MIVATTPVVRWKSKSASCSCASITLRSETTSTVSNTFLCSASCSSARKCAVQAMEFVLPEPAECWIRYLPPGPSAQHGRLQLARDVELVVAREDDLLDLLLLVALGDQVAAQDLQPALALPDLLPQVGRAVAAGRVHRVARRAVVALVEGQERRGRPVQLGHHVHFAVADREVHQRPAGERQQRLGGLALGLGQPVEAVLVDRVADALGEVGLQLDRRHRQAVQEQHQVDAVLVVQRVAHLPHHAQPVGGVAGQDVGVDGQRRLELRPASAAACRPEQLDAVAQHVQRAALVELVAQAGQQRLAGLRAVVLRRASPTPWAGSPAPRPARRPGTAPAPGRSPRRRPRRRASRARRGAAQISVSKLISLCRLMRGLGSARSNGQLLNRLA